MFSWHLFASDPNFRHLQIKLIRAFENRNVLDGERERDRKMKETKRNSIAMSEREETGKIDERTFDETDSTIRRSIYVCVYIYIQIMLSETG